MRPEPENPLLGDRIEAIIKSVGVTKDRYKLFKSWLLRVRPQDVTCNCETRQEFFNHLHKTFLEWMGE